MQVARLDGGNTEACQGNTERFCGYNPPPVGCFLFSTFCWEGLPLKVKPTKKGCLLFSDCHWASENLRRAFCFLFLTSVCMGLGIPTMLERVTTSGVHGLQQLFGLRPFKWQRRRLDCVWRIYQEVSYSNGELRGKTRSPLRRSFTWRSHKLL